MTFGSVLRYRTYCLRRNDRPKKRASLRITRPIRARVTLREVAADDITFNELFILEVYRVVLDHVPNCRTIIDLGANIGLASLYFAMRYPHSTILPVEPNAQNHELLTQNMKGLIRVGRCKTPLRAAVWGGSKVLVAAGSPSADGYNAFSFRELAPGEQVRADEVPGMNVEKIIEQSGFGHVDLVKIDIEGAEVELFKGRPNWLERTRSIAIEFHGTTRESSEFDRVMHEYGFKIFDENPHTVVAVKNGD